MSTLAALLAWLLAMAGAPGAADDKQPCDDFQPGSTCVELPGSTSATDDAPPAPPRAGISADKDDDPIYNGF